MGNKTNAVATAQLNALTTPFVGLLTTLPVDGDAATAVEVTGGAYARQPVTLDEGPTYDAANDRMYRRSSAAIPFPRATASWGELAGIGWWNEESGGVLQYFFPLATPKTVNLNDDPVIPEYQAMIIES